MTMVATAHKLFEGFWGKALKPHLRPLPMAILGFRAGCQPLDVSAPLQMFLRKAHEWHFPLAIVSMDVRAAFDRMRLPLVASALRVPAQLVASWLTDAVGSSLTVALGPATAPPVQLQVGCKQRGAAIPCFGTSCWRAQSRGYNASERALMWSSMGTGVVGI